MPYTYVGQGTQSSPKVGDMWINADGSINAYYTGMNWESGGALSSTQAQAALQASTGLTKGTMASPSIVAYESATVAYDGTNYVNPQTGAIYGPDPPSGGWRATMDPKYASYVTQALASQPSQSTTTTSTNAVQTQPTGSTAVQSNTAAAGSNAPVASATTVNSGSLTNLLTQTGNFVSTNPLLALAALAVVAFMFMGEGGGKHARYS